MKKSHFAIPAAALILGISGCSQLDQSVTDCDNLRDEIVELSEEDRQSRVMLLSKLESLKHYLNPTTKFHAVAQLYGAMATKLLSPMKAISMRTEIE